MLKVKLWIVVLNWNQGELTRLCIQSVLNSSFREFEVVVVDNASTDGSVVRLREQFPQVHLISCKRNLGFAGGNNVGTKYALERGAEWIWLLNNDTEVARDAIENLIEAIGIYPQFGIFGPKISYFIPKNRIWYAGGHIQLWRATGAIHWGIGKTDNGEYDEIREISFVTGCALLIKRSVIESVGLLDEDLFAYAEDLDWCIRANRLGHHALYVPQVQIWHKVSQSVQGRNGRFLQVYLSARNRFILQKRYGSLLRSQLTLSPVYLVSRNARQAFRQALRGEISELEALLQGLVDGLKGRARRYPSDSGRH